jgi:hypothetical protein
LAIGPGYQTIRKADMARASTKTRNVVAQKDAQASPELNLAEQGNPWPADAVERRPVASLTPYANNARLHSPAQVAQLAASIREWGWTMPCLVDERGGLIAGHGRVLAAQQIGLADVPVMVARGWTEEQKRAYVIADNKLTLNATWDDALLASEIAALHASSYDVSLLGFSSDELVGIAAVKNGGLTDPDEVPEPQPEVVSRLGDVWLLGAKVTCPHCGTKQDIKRAVV